MVNTKVTSKSQGKHQEQVKEIYLYLFLNEHVVGKLLHI